MWRQAFVVFYFGLLSAVGGDTDSTASFDEWSGWGANHYNNRWASENTAVSSSSITSLAPFCKIPYPVGASATPVVSGDIVFYPTWNGSFVALDYITCQVLWQINVTDIISGYAPITELQRNYSKAVSRTSPQLDNEVLYFGTNMHALIVAVNRFTGTTLGVIQMNPHPLASGTMSPTLYNGILFVGASSSEEAADALPGYTCCSFVGNFLAMTFDSSNRKFEVLWNVSMIPEIEAARGWSGAGVWGSQPSIDPSRGQVFIATGNTYSIPEAIVECQNATQNITAVIDGLVPDPCLPRDVWQEAVLAIDIKTGIVKWAHHLSPLDAFTVACESPTNKVECPEKPGLDVDYGMAPVFVPGSDSTPYQKDTVVVGQKNGNLYAMSAEAGELFWATLTSPGAPTGDLSWGIAVDDGRVYFTVINIIDFAFTLEPSGQKTNRSAHGAASLLNGTLLWEVPTPGVGGVAYGPPTVVGDIVLVSKTGSDPAGTLSFDSTVGSLLAFDKRTGELITSFVLDGNFHGGVAVQGQSVLFGTGYNNLFNVPNPTGGSFHVMRVET